MGARKNRLIETVLLSTNIICFGSDIRATRAAVDGISTQTTVFFTVDLYLRVKVIQNAAQYPTYHMTYASAKVEVATSNGLGEDAFTGKYVIRSRSHKM